MDVAVDQTQEEANLIIRPDVAAGDAVAVVVKGRLLLGLLLGVFLRLVGSGGDGHGNFFGVEVVGLIAPKWHLARVWIRC